jgi:hypothetical protein
VFFGSMKILLLAGMPKHLRMWPVVVPPFLPLSKRNTNFQAEKESRHCIW